MKKNIGYAMVPVDLATVGTELTIATPSGDAPAAVVLKPFIDAAKTVPKS